MSVSKEKNVPQLVEKYRREFPNLERPLLRKLIRLENKIESESELKKLDRHLAKAFKNEEPSKPLMEGLTREDLNFWMLSQFTMTWEERKELLKRLLQKAYGKGEVE